MPWSLHRGRPLYHGYFCWYYDGPPLKQEGKFKYGKNFEVKIMIQSFFQQIFKCGITI